MRQLKIAGKVIEVSEVYFLNTISNLVKGYYVLAEAYYNYHFSGFADWKDIFQITDVGQNEVVEALADQIDDQELIKTFGSMRKQLKEIQVVDREIIDWLAKLVGLSSVRDQKEKNKLGRQLRKIVGGGPDGRTQGPVWALHPEYQELVAKSKLILVQMEETQQRINQRIHQLLENLNDI